jgi:hypothetical protein
MFVITAQAQAELEKGRKWRERERMGEVEDCEPASGAHAAAEGWRDAMEAEHQDGAEKAYGGIGVTDGPGHPMHPDEIGAGDFTRGYISAGHAADAPGNPAGLHAAPVPHIDLTASRGTLTHINPTAPMGPGGRP